MTEQQVEKPKLNISRRNNGIAGGANARTAIVPTDIEFESLDALGPITRRVIVEGPLPFLAADIYRQVLEINVQIEQNNEIRKARGEPLKPLVNMKDPKVDAGLAKGLLAHNYANMKHDRDEDHVQMGFKPLVAKLSAKTIRERKKTEGRRFRGW